MFVCLCDDVFFFSTFLFGGNMSDSGNLGWSGSGCLYPSSNAPLSPQCLQKFPWWACCDIDDDMRGWQLCHLCNRYTKSAFWMLYMLAMSSAYHFISFSNVYFHEFCILIIIFSFIICFAYFKIFHSYFFLLFFCNQNKYFNVLVEYISCHEDYSRTGRLRLIPWRL